MINPYIFPSVFICMSFKSMNKHIVITAVPLVRKYSINIGFTKQAAIVISNNITYFNFPFSFNQRERNISQKP